MKNQFFIELNFLFIVGLIKKVVIGVLLHMQFFYTPVNHTLQFLYIDTSAFGIEGRRERGIAGTEVFSRLSDMPERRRAEVAGMSELAADAARESPEIRCGTEPERRVRVFSGRCPADVRFSSEKTGTVANRSGWTRRADHTGI